MHGPTRVFWANLTPFSLQHKVHAYLSGHDHTMQHHRVEEVDYFVCGTGSKIGGTGRGR